MIPDPGAFDFVKDLAVAIRKGEITRDDGLADHRHARRTERLMASYYDVLSRGDDDPDELPRFRARLRAHRIGLFDNFDTPFRMVELRRARPSVVYRVLYPALILIAAFFAVGIFVGFLTPTSMPIAPIPGQLVPPP